MTIPSKATKPGNRRSRAVAAPGAGDPAASPGGPEQAAALQLKAAKQQIKRLKAQLTAALSTIDELRASADTDFLLGILNRRGFQRELDRAVAYIKRYGATGALIMIDVDRLKPINDRFGHAAGDEVLKAVVAEMLRQVRASDVLARLGGDEFVLLLWNLSEADAHAKADTLENGVDALRFQFSGESAQAGISTGVAMLGPQSDAREAMAAADRAMYARKLVRRRLAAEAAESAAQEVATR
ncbi:diguanylate cyclase [Rhodopseudomonas faecalis]|uniref:diguanylate cyclase n=1 Tax=Rhodopseudomonas faecalis TaxID=99655 RepID=A0A318TL55_9BRAD|nr:GGDEF domain-containing protein [Rhodopseudomonas faecalis]PYF02575.1 diguanylate cyclase [Rhodopseudomonas faecalis]